MEVRNNSMTVTSISSIPQGNSCQPKMCAAKAHIFGN